MVPVSLVMLVRWLTHHAVYSFVSTPGSYYSSQGSLKLDKLWVADDQSRKWNPCPGARDLNAVQSCPVDDFTMIRLQCLKIMACNS